MRKVLIIVGISLMFSGCFSTVLVECKTPTKVGDKIFCEK
jgi:hypothetical protein